MAGDRRIDVDHLAELARLRLSEGERATYERDLGRILAAFEALQTVATEGVEPFVHAMTRACQPRPDRPDGAASSDQGQDLAARHGPATDAGLYVVPPVLG